MRPIPVGLTVYTTTLIIPTSPCQPTQTLAGSIFSHFWNPYPTFPGTVHDLHRRLYTVLGRPYGGFPHFGYLDPCRTQAPYLRSLALAHSELRTTQEGELILIAPGGRFNHGSHIYCVCVWTTLHHSVPLGITVTIRVCLGRQVIPSVHLRLSCRTTKQQDFQRGL